MYVLSINYLMNKRCIHRDRVNCLHYVHEIALGASVVFIFLLFFTTFALYTVCSYGLFMLFRPRQIC